MGQKKKKGIFFRIFGILDTIRKLILNILFWGLLIILFLQFVPLKQELGEDAVLRITPGQSIVEMNEGAELPSWLKELDTHGDDTSLLRMIRVINHAAADKKINGIYMDLSFLEHASLGALQEIALALENFKAGGKKILVWASAYSQSAWYLAACGDEVYMDPMGQVRLPGLGIYRFYYKGAMEHWNMDAAYIQAGEYKSYGEIFLRSSMSEDMKRENRRWLNNLWGQYLGQSARRRNMKASFLKKWIDHYPSSSEAEGMRESNCALEGGLLDRLVEGSERDDILSRYFGEGAQNMVDMEDYTFSPEEEDGSSQGRIAVLTLSGEIHEGPSRPYTIGAQGALDALDRVAQESGVRALVLRLDTGGGSAYASELIRRKLESLKKQGIPVIISMGGITASGGYWIATAGNEIWTEPGCITGSIGVFTLIPQFERFSRENLHLNNDGVGTTWMSGQDSPGRNLNSHSLALLQTSVDDTYKQFLNLVSQSRGISLKQLLPLAEGRVWSGLEAVKIGLADNAGSLTEAVKAAAKLAGLEEYDIWYYKEEMPPLEDLFREMFFSSSSSAMASSFPGKLLTRIFAPMDNLNLEPQEVYALWRP